MTALAKIETIAQRTSDQLNAAAEELWECSRYGEVLSLHSAINSMMDAVQKLRNLTASTKRIAKEEAIVCSLEDSIRALRALTTSMDDYNCPTMSFLMDHVLHTTTKNFNVRIYQLDGNQSVGIPYTVKTQGTDAFFHTSSQLTNVTSVRESIGELVERLYEERDEVLEHHPMSCVSCVNDDSTTFYQHYRSMLNAWARMVLPDLRNIKGVISCYVDDSDCKTVKVRAIIEDGVVLPDKYDWVQPTLMSEITVDEFAQEE